MADATAVDMAAPCDAPADAVPAVSRPDMIRFETAIPRGFTGYVPLDQHVRPENPARTYGFKLDPFQQHAIDCIERSESVLVAAHTSAGKTVVAEYAIAKALRDRQRVIYTSPIKALSNQKYREFGEAFDGDVGLMTGDVTLNPTASCLVMTTEILRSMLYRGSEVMREVSWVIFDEIHYMRDRERGVVWEETLILLPDTVRFVFLSATIPNARQFADWVADIHRQPCHVVYTSFRPTPLQHYVCPAGADGIFLVVDEKGTFREDNFARALSTLSDGKSSGGGDGNGAAAVLGEDVGGSDGRRRKRGRRGATGHADIQRIIGLIVRRGLAPAIVFSFSKRECEELAMAAAGGPQRLDLNSEEERRLVTSVFENAIESLSVEDRTLPQIVSILPLLKAGVGIHHSGLLPILKEVIEILFQEGLIKVLFATETFSIGLNMPARTVVFTAARKFDGTESRFLLPGEYVQMAGRAGRRGLDARGIVILMLDEDMSPIAARRMLKGDADALNSAFHLSYNMILNLMRVGEDATPEYMLRRSFHQFQTAAALPALEAEREAAALVLEQTLPPAEVLPGVSQDDLDTYWALLREQDALHLAMRAVANRPEHAVPFMQPGRLVRVRDGSLDYGWCVVVGVGKRSAPRSARNKGSEEARYVVDVLALCARQSAAERLRSSRPALPQPADPSAPAAASEMQMLPALLSTLDGVSQARIYMPRDVRGAEGRTAVRKALAEVSKRFPAGPPLLDAVADLGVRDAAYAQSASRLRAVETEIFAHAVHRAPRAAEALASMQAREEQRTALAALDAKIIDVAAVVHMDELHARKRLLTALGYSVGSAADVVSMKGRVACEISTGEEILLTEMIFAGAFNDLAPEVVAAVLSCIVFEERVPSSGSSIGASGGPADAEEPAAAGDAEEETEAAEAPVQPAAEGSSGGLRLREELAAPLRVLQETAHRVARASVEAGVPLEGGSEEAYVQTLRPELMEVVYQWCRGARFARICKMTEVFEGSIIRCMRRLEELLRQLTQAAHSIGNSALEAKFSDAIARLKRDIVFANSLYL